MASNARRFSQTRDDLSETSIAGVFAKTRCGSSTGSTQDCTRKPKRRRTSGLNARFDNMVRAMDATYPGPLSLQQRQTRARSSSDASHLSSAISDAYSDLHEGRIGENFTLVKMQPLTDSCAGSIQTKTPSGRSHNRSENTPSVRKDLPEWLRSTFSSLSEKHPLRLLLPNKCQQTDANDHRSNDLKTDPAFAFGLDRITHTMPNGLQTVDLFGPTNNRHLAFCTVPPSPTSLDVYSPNSKDNVQQSQSLSATCGDHVPLTLDPVSFSTPKPNTVSMRELPLTFDLNEFYEQDPNPAAELKSLTFIPFSTPGPASTLGSCVATNSLPSIPDSRANCLVDVDIETSACFPRHTTITFPISHSRHTSTESSAVDSCLPPYRAATSDPAPAYSSDGIYDNAYNADPSRDESDSEPRGLTDDCANVLATPCASRPLFFDSPTEEPSGHSKPGFEIDLDAIDFKWTPFNRKLVEEKTLSPDDQRRSVARNNLVPKYSELGINCTVISRAGSPEVTLLPESITSPSPFRFTPQQLTTNTNSTFNHEEPQPTQTTKLSQPFAPAPGIYVSPLRDKMEAQTSVPRTPQNQIIRTESLKPDLDVKTEFPSSQSSCDSIQSWRDADEDCP